MGRRTLLLIASILVAAVGTGVVALYANSAQDRAFQDSNPTEVWFVTQDIPAGIPVATAIRAAQRRKVSSNAVPGDALPLRPALPAGVVTSRVIKTGEILRASTFAGPGQTTDTGNPLGLEDKRLAVSVTVTDVARVAGYAGPGSYVALYVTRPDPDKADRQRINLLFEQPLKVLKVSIAGAQGPTPNQTLVTLDVDQVQASRLILASQTESNIYMALVKDEKARLDPDAPLTDDKLQTAGP